MLGCLLQHFQFSLPPVSLSLPPSLAGLTVGGGQGFCGDYIQDIPPLASICLVALTPIALCYRPVN